MTLAMANRNEELKILEVGHGHKFKKRLSDMGIYKDATVKIVKNDIPGPLIIEVKGSQLIMGRGQAQKIMVEGT
ncbi:MAG: FeoA domain protein [Methanobacterium sp. PtaU1.Bin242]|nr:MAG: FeoA domain protein [Methanobacterium sp. PtaU1.Bin242]